MKTFITAMEPQISTNYKIWQNMPSCFTLRIVLSVIFLPILPVITKLFTIFLPINKAANVARSSADHRMVVSQTYILSSHNKTVQFSFNIMTCTFLWECLHWVAGIICCRNLKNFLLVTVLVSTLSAHSDRHCNFTPSFSQYNFNFNALAMTLAMPFM